MDSSERKNHWENIYTSKKFEEVSWYQQEPSTSLSFLEEYSIDMDAKIIDIGGGDSYFVDYLLELNYSNITVLDISESAIERAKLRLGHEKSAKVKWIISDASTFIPIEKYDFWHDRAAFHFLTNEEDIHNYIKIASDNINPDGTLVIGTFSEEGPEKCSGIKIQQYSENSLSNKFLEYFEKIKCTNIDHKTPFDTIQNFVFCSFRKSKQ